MFFRSKGSKPESNAKTEQPASPPADHKPAPAAAVVAAPPAAAAKAPVASPQAVPAVSAQATPQAAAAKAADPERKRRIALARKKSAAFGQVVAVMSRSERHRNLPIGEVRWLVAPPVRSGQFMLAGKRAQKNGMVIPAAALMWASVSDEIDKQLTAASKPVRLAPKAWTSGDNLWLIEAVGDPALVPKMIERLGTKEWKGRTVKVRSRQPDGSLGVQAIGPL